ncbi:murein L,D-transpeptidase [Xenorhabdus sp. 12]|uniref:Murein L,D-transpeptidase n=1 Tax=Xenorhabdus santafensis TaxID=2582833 RepID=A0ABU4S7R4_9GAMM|nr:murein L,D-transpeptidase family protein [Xenorhabdus sp. 12]MDX7986751.1 murein L,D-transpeptidase [Xenorhabdus sp. 12]
MKKIIFSLSVNLLLFHIPLSAIAQATIQPPPSSWLNLPRQKTLLKQLGAEVFIQILKEEKLLEIYTKNSEGRYQLAQSYPICSYSGGLGPKILPGDFKSPEGFYHVRLKQLKPNSRYYRAINLGFPNEFDKSRGYSGSNLMIHGECKSIGCYAMTNRYMDEIYQYTESALYHGQHEIKINIYPFRMTSQNMMRHKNNDNYPFWEQLQPAYEYFAKHGVPANVSIIGGQYIVNADPEKQPLTGNTESNHTLTKME